MNQYKENLKDIQKTCCESVTELLIEHMNYIHDIFSDKKKANKYIRQMGLNSIEKLPDLFLYMNMPKVKNEELKVTIKNPDEIMKENRLEFDANVVIKIKDELKRMCPEILWKNC